MSKVEDLLTVMRRLRDPEEGCPWDRAQSFATIVPHTIEEVYEVADAIERGDMDDLCGELGDLLFQVVFYAQLASEAGAFGFEEIVTTLLDKLVRRHPHVFAHERKPASAAAQSVAWEAHKRVERNAKGGDGREVASLLDGVAKALPALSRGVKLQRRAAHVGFDWNDINAVVDKVEEEITEVREELQAGAQTSRMHHEIGDLLFACANLARHAGVDVEMAMAAANGRFEKRFRYIEEKLAQQDRKLEQASIEEMEALWNEAKREYG